jgi:hypothetical protein
VTISINPRPLVIAPLLPDADGRIICTLDEMFGALIWNFQQLDPGQQEQIRKEMYESVTEKPYRPERVQ